MQKNKIAWLPKPGVSKEILMRVQQRLFEMAVATKTILEAHGIPYIIAYGTLLGAIRHGGFIPWDDDFDMYLFDDSYDAALSALRDELPEGMFLEDEFSEPKYFHGWAHVKDLGSQASCGMYAHDNCYSHNGIHIDLYRALEVTRRNLIERLRSENLAYINRRRSKDLMSDEEYARRMGNLDAPIDFLDSSTGDDDVGYALTVPYRYKFMLKSDVFPLQRYKFNGVDFLGPSNANGILSYIYGNYIELPPLEKRMPKYDCVEFI